MLIEKPTGTIHIEYDFNNEPYLFEATGTEAKRFIDIMNANDFGRLVVLPCKVGDTVWRYDSGECGIASIDKGTVYAVSINEKIRWFSTRYMRGLRYDYTWDDLGKTVFLTREEAEEAMRKGEEQ